MRDELKRLLDAAFHGLIDFFDQKTSL